MKTETIKYEVKAEGIKELKEKVDEVTKLIDEINHMDVVVTAELVKDRKK